jgi:ubiquinone/menaquinone biosynthesis C-methylase UbiE
MVSPARTTPRVDYDAIAPLYDAQPHREKAADPELIAVLSGRIAAEPLSVLDIGCGTGNQLVANRTIAAPARLVGIDRSLGMLRQARPKAADIAWVQADAADLPFRERSFDFVSCQFALHHISDKSGMLREAFRVLRGGGRLVVRNLCPQECPDWLYYQYFPEALATDLDDFWPPDAMVAATKAAGFASVAIERQHLRFEQDLRSWLATVQRRDTCSQLLAISDAAYATGIERLEREMENAGGPVMRADHLCLITLHGDKT